jgi:hypothetical protein
MLKLYANQSFFHRPAIRYRKMRRSGTKVSEESTARCASRLSSLLFDRNIDLGADRLDHPGRCLVD